MLHERLTSYLDSVEVCLLKQISSKANTFFAALKNLRNFKNEVNESCAKMRTLRGLVRLLKQSLVIDLAKVPQNRIRRRNLERLSHTVALMTEVRSTKKTVQSLLEVGDYHGSLNLIDRVQSVLKEELSGLTCMRHLSRQLLKFQNLIRDTMCDRFLELAVLRWIFLVTPRVMMMRMRIRSMIRGGQDTSYTSASGAQGEAITSRTRTPSHWTSSKFNF